MDTITINGDYLKSLSPHKLSRWLQVNRLELAGGGTFTIADTFFKKPIQWATKKYLHKGDTFCPTHTGIIILCNCQLYIVDIVPPKVQLTNLYDYITTTKDEFKIVMRGENFNLDTRRFSYEAFCWVDKKYGYFSAICSSLALKKYINGFGLHCSEGLIKLYNNQGIFTDVNSDDITPVEAFNLLVYGEV